MSLQSFPRGIYVAGPQERGVTLHSSITIAMQRVGSLIRPIDLRPFPVHAVSHQTRWDIEGVAFVWPPTIDPHSEIFSVGVPIATGFGLVETRQVAFVVDGTAQCVRKNHHMRHGTKMLLMQLIQYYLRVGKNSGIPIVCAILAIPTRWAKTCAQIDQSVAG